MLASILASNNGNVKLWNAESLHSANPQSNEAPAFPSRESRGFDLFLSVCDDLIQLICNGNQGR